MPVVTVGELRTWEPEALGDATAQAFEIPQLDGFWVHLDADVLDPTVMPAVDSPDPDGLLPGELLALLRPLLASPRCVGLNVTIYDPDLDPDGTAGTLLTDIVVCARPLWGVGPTRRRSGRRTRTPSRPGGGRPGCGPPGSAPGPR